MSIKKVDSSIHFSINNPIYLPINLYSYLEKGTYLFLGGKGVSANKQKDERTNKNICNEMQLMIRQSMVRQERQDGTSRARSKF